MDERVKPIRITINETGEVYVLEFTRATVKFADQRGFDINDVERFPTSKIPELFWYALRAHHPYISSEKAESILFNEVKTITKPMLKRLCELYLSPVSSLMVEEEDANPNMTVEM